MKIFFLLFILLFPLASISQQFWTKKLSAFSILKLEGRMKVNLTQGQAYKVEANIHGDGVELENLKFTQKEGELKVHYQGGALKDVDLILTFYLPKAVNIEANRGIVVRCKNGYVLKAKKISIATFAGGKVAANVHCEKLLATIRQGGSIRLSGEATEVDCKVLTGGTISTAKLNAKVVKAKITMGGEIITQATDLLDAKVTSGGVVSYKGTPKKVKQNVTLGGTIKQL